MFIVSSVRVCFCVLLLIKEGLINLADIDYRDLDPLLRIILAFSSQGRFLTTPELVPFRLTRDIVDGMGVAGTEGVMRRSCEACMKVLRANKDSLMTVRKGTDQWPHFTHPPTKPLQPSSNQHNHINQHNRINRLPQVVTVVITDPLYKWAMTSLLEG